MSRQSAAAARNLTLTEELEKLEQSITLTLQEIDHNFSRAHRIVTTSILPVVEQYAKHSEAVWEGSKFWKQFFEASANVSLSGYEEAAIDDDATYADHTNAGSSAFGSRTTTPVDDTMTTDKYRSDGEEHDLQDIDESLLTSPSVHASSTPREPPTTRAKAKAKFPSKPPTTTATIADYPSPYESLKREIQGSSSPPAAPPTTTIAIDPVTPGKAQSTLPDMTMSPDSSPFAMSASTAQNDGRKQNNDVLLHRVLDKNYRIAATPHTARKTTQHAKSAMGTTPATTTRTGAARFLDSSPMSSPDVPAPQLRADLFSPAKARTPGVSVQTPSYKRRARKSLDTDGGAAAGEQRTRDIFGTTTMRSRAAFESDSEDDTNDLGFSPPKTMQFHIPQSRILQTPAREASKRIVEDLLLTAGGDITDSQELHIQDEDSPSVVRRNEALDDSF
ncbi:hypothetical protein NA57DRAFT_73279 [Rhizodiscina lignyota]|uniref:DASH complex subunit ASK1 n=1 Tax=Rhizodiscina lignyota TaxID=1504668 RepID=A0A9P4ILX7_9PEZI|nr:hypothetical protein NA57DRAFT_73279 [Rhizodiscina lignyota]